MALVHSGTNPFLIYHYGNLQSKFLPNLSIGDFSSRRLRSVKDLVDKSEIDFIEDAPHYALFFDFSPKAVSEASDEIAGIEGVIDLG